MKCPDWLLRAKIWMLSFMEVPFDRLIAMTGATVILRARITLLRFDAAVLCRPAWPIIRCQAELQTELERRQEP